MAHFLWLGPTQILALKNLTNKRGIFVIAIAKSILVIGVIFTRRVIQHIYLNAAHYWTPRKLVLVGHQINIGLYLDMNVSSNYLIICIESCPNSQVERSGGCSKVARGVTCARAVCYTSQDVWQTLTATAIICHNTIKLRARDKIRLSAYFFFFLLQSSMVPQCYAASAETKPVDFITVCIPVKAAR